MKLGKLEYFSAKGSCGKFEILNLELENDENTLSGKFTENGKELKVLDESFYWLEYYKNP